MITGKSRLRVYKHLLYYSLNFEAGIWNITDLKKSNKNLYFIGTQIYIHWKSNHYWK